VSRWDSTKKTRPIRFGTPVRKIEGAADRNADQTRQLGSIIDGRKIPTRRRLRARSFGLAVQLKLRQLAQHRLGAKMIMLAAFSGWRPGAELAASARDQIFCGRLDPGTRENLGRYRCSAL